MHCKQLKTERANTKLYRFKYICVCVVCVYMCVCAGEEGGPRESEDGMDMDRHTHTDG